MSISPLAASPSGFTNSGTGNSMPATSGASVPGAAPSATIQSSDSVKVGAVGIVASAAAADKGQQASSKELKEAVAKLNERLKPFISEAVRFNVDEGSGKLVVTVVDTEKNTVLRQIPTEEALKMSRETDPKQAGLLLNTKA